MTENESFALKENLLERERVSPSPTIMSDGALGKKPITTPLSVYIKDHYGEDWRDIEKATKGLMIAEWQDVIDLIGMRPVFTVTELHGFIKLAHVKLQKCSRKTRKAEYHIEPPSRSAVTDFCKFLHEEYFLKMMVVETGYFKPAKVYYVIGTPPEIIERSIEYFKACANDYERKKKPKAKTPEEVVAHNEKVLLLSTPAIEKRKKIKWIQEFRMRPEVIRDGWEGLLQTFTEEELKEVLEQLKIKVASN